MNISKTRFLSLLLIGASTVLGACANTGVKQDSYVLFRQYMPRSILVLPPINQSLEVNATYSWLTTATVPIAEKGFYVFPVAIVDEFMKENGLPNPEDMHAAPLDKIGEIFGADAVMYVTIEDFGQKFQLLSSVTKVYVNAKLVDVKTGEVFWTDRVQYSESNSNSSGGGLLGALVSAAVAQVGESINDSTHDASRTANNQLFRGSSGLLLGPLHYGYEEQMEAAALAAAEAEAAAAQGELPAE